MNNQTVTVTPQIDQQIISGILAICINGLSAIVILLIRCFEKKQLTKFLKDVEIKNNDLISNLTTHRSQDVVEEMRNVNSPYASETNYPTQTNNRVIPLDTNRNLVIKPKENI